MNSLKVLIEEFWQWTEKPKEKWYSYDISYLPTEPVKFPKLGQICDACIRMINTSMTPEEMTLFLMGLAIDNEDEDILDACREFGDNWFLEQLISAGLSFPQSHARWQLAELLRRNISGRENYLNRLAMDDHCYVRRRANNIRLELKKQTQKKD